MQFIYNGFCKLKYLALVRKTFTQNICTDNNKKKDKNVAVHDYAWIEHEYAMILFTIEIENYFKFIDRLYYMCKICLLKST